MMHSGTIRTLVFGALLSGLVCFAAQPAQAAFPTKQITILQGYKAGGGSDALAQVTQPALSQILTPGFINQYMPGANSAIMLTKLAKQTKADGYTLGISCTPPIYTNYVMNEKITYRLDEFDTIANIVTDPGVVVVGKDSPYKTFEDFKKDCQARSGKVTVANSGIGGDDFFATLMFEKISGLKTKPVPFEGDGPSWQAAMGGKVDVSFNNLGITYPQIKGGNLRVLAIMAENRYHLLPDTPTMKELGYDVVTGSSRGYSAPKGTPDDVKKILIDAFKKMAADPQFIKACEDRALVVDMRYGQEYMDMMKKDEKYYGELWEEVKGQYTN
ncbi:Trap-t family transporter, periplasmic binding protein [uncultured delta proteobacterium]|uniref:Trap-t family transporter, periplasmic binding protein n=1 Tax=uncultured delta proteobacterium TaxID=34034 RepID=A0A212K9W4_9DELT|nr:Trap-t family transporter, periplasmic binding protein [uncultured delta proteobacterium]